MFAAEIAPAKGPRNASSPLTTLCGQRVSLAPMRKLPPSGDRRPARPYTLKRERRTIEVFFANSEVVLRDFQESATLVNEQRDAALDVRAAIDRCEP